MHLVIAKFEKGLLRYFVSDTGDKTIMPFIFDSYYKACLIAEKYGNGVVVMVVNEKEYGGVVK